jgi:hypothetical protein
MQIDFYDRKPRRQYVIGSRRCRQRAAQRLGLGMAPGEVAAIERRPVEEVEALLQDGSFQDLVAHYEKLASLTAEERRARLVRLAQAMLERLVAAADLRAVAYVLHEEACGRDAGVSLALRVERKVASPPAPEMQAQPRRAPPPDPALLWPDPLGTLPARPAEPFSFCATAQPSEEAASALAGAEAARADRRLGRASCQLAAGLAAEAEREGTTEIDENAPCRAAAKGIARGVYSHPAPAIEAAFKVQETRNRYRAGLPPEPLPPASHAADMKPAKTDTAVAASPPGMRERQRLPAWLDRVDYRVRLHAERLPAHEVAPYLRRVGRFYGFDTS